MDEDQAFSQLDDAIRTVNTGLVVKWVLIADVATVEGRQLQPIYSGDTPMWDVIGMLNYGLEHLTASVYQGDDE